MTAGMPNSRESTAGCDVVPPVSVTRPAIFVNSTTHAGFVIWHTRMSPSLTCVELVDGRHDARDALDHARRPGDP